MLDKQVRQQDKKKEYLLGTDEYGIKYWLESESWDCNWYWGFGYLGNKNCHYHLKNYKQMDYSN